MKKLSQKYKYFLGLLLLCSVHLMTGCDTSSVDDGGDGEEIGPVEPSEPDYTETEITVSTIAQFRTAVLLSDKVITMTPGVYTIEGTMPEDANTIVHFSGSNNEINLDEVTIIVPTMVLRAMGPANVEELATYRIDGSNILFNGGKFENTGDSRPYASLSEFEVWGDNISFLGCEIIIRGSESYGYGDIYGTGEDGDDAVRMFLHSAMSILGNNVLVQDCDFKVFALGYGIQIHGADNTIIRNVTVEGAKRLTDELYNEVSGTPASTSGYTYYFPEFKRDLPIVKEEMISLAKDGIRAYPFGFTAEGDYVETKNITIENCFINKMRGGLNLADAKGDIIVTDNTSINCEYAYSFGNNTIVRNSKGNTAFGPLLILPFSTPGSSDIELELLDSEITMGDHALAEISGENHKVTFTYSGTQPLENLRDIKIGVAEDWGDYEYRSDEELLSLYGASGTVLNNHTSNPIVLGLYSSTSNVTTNNVEVEDLGTSNTVTIIE